jgi:hypothetical protein
MEDTPKQIKQLVYKTVMARTEEDRFLMCAEMFEVAKEFAKVGLPKGLSPDDEMKAVIKKLYGDCLGQSEAETKLI